MRRFLRDVAVFAGVQLLVLLLLSLRLPPPHPAFAVAVARKSRLVDMAPGPRLLFVGGSNVGCGIDSPAFHASLGFHPVNLGLNAEVGLDAMLNEAARAARPGDVIVISPEFEHFMYDVTNPQTIVAIGRASRETLQNLSWTQIRTLADRSLVYLHQLVRVALRRRRVTFSLQAETAAAELSYNEYGDLTGHHNLPSKYRGETHRTNLCVLDPRYLRAVVENLNGFERRCRARGIRVFFSFPPIARDAYLARPSIDAIVRTVDEGLEFPILAPAKKTVYPERMFFDTAYHLTLEGKRARSALVATGLRRYLFGDQPSVARRHERTGVAAESR
jgi:hypothetical protein